MRYFAVEHALIHPQQIASAPNDAGCAHDAVDSAILESPAQYEKFPNKTVEQRQSHGRQHSKQKESSVDRHRRGKAAKFGDLIGVPPFVENSCQHEQCARRNSVGQHHVGRAIESGLREAENAKHHKAQVADR